MKYHISTEFLELENSVCLVFGIFEDLKLSESILKIDFQSGGYINKLIKNKDITGQFNKFLLLHSIPNFYKTKVLFLGCGNKKFFNVNIYKKLFNLSFKIIKDLSINTVKYFLTDLDIQNSNVYWKIRFAISELQNCLYSFKIFKTYDNKQENETSFNKVYFHVLFKSDVNCGKNAIKHESAISLGKKLSKDLSNMPPNICNPSYLADQVIKLSQKYPNIITTDIINHKDMKKLKMNAYLSVGKGSKNKSLMSVIKYIGTTDTNIKNIVFIGKGVTFDSGGVSIKPSSHLDEMKFDMSGAAIVFGLMSVLSELKLPLNVIGILAGSENMVGGKAFRPGDILTTMSGKTVEILNTDAEGRLILCDVLTYVKRFNPGIVIDIATLTGACVVALGNHITGLLSNNQDLIQSLKIASVQTEDLIWEMPLYKEYDEDLKSEIADMTNVGKNSAGMITAACFLSKFSQEYVWAHLDIAGTAWASGKNKGSTGRPIDLLSQFLLNQVNQ